MDSFTNAASVALNAAFAWLVHQSFQPEFVFASTFLLVLVAIQIRNAILRARRMREIEKDMEDLRAANTDLRSALQSTQRKVAEATLAIATKSDAREKKITSELQLIERLVREFAVSAQARAERASMVEAAPAAASGPVADTPMLEIIRRALEENRVDLHLQPVVSLPQRKLRFFEALSRLRSDDGTVIMPEQYIRVAAPAGLMSVVDNLLLFRCVQLVRRLAQKHRDAAVFCNISGHTLADAEFFPQFLDFMHHHRDLAGQIVFEFSQDAVLAAGSSEEANLRYLANLGFKLSLDQVTKLDIDFARLRKLGFHFFKLKAQTLISGMRQAKAAVAAEDFKDHLLRNGLQLIVERVEDEKTVVQLLEYNVDFGQGYLFGEPRPIKDVPEVVEPRSPQQPAKSASPIERLARRRLAN
jgi:cyclic-di-GMP phosphodiesterase TipF (flagellum assembly factor)